MHLFKKEHDSVPLWAYFLFILIIFLWMITPTLNKVFATTEDMANVGNSFGTISALFSGLAFAAMIVTLYLQKKELQLQRADLALQRDEMHSQTEQFQKQNETLQIQKFENTFFQMVTLHHELVKSFSLKYPKQEYSGRECFQYLYTTFSGDLGATVLEKQPTLYQTYEALRKYGSLQNTIIGYDCFFKKNQSQLGHYFRNLYHIFKFIDKAQMQNKEIYSAILIAQLSSYELALLFYNCLHSVGSANFKPLVEKYAVLKNMDKELIFNPEHSKEFTPSAYGHR